MRELRELPLLLSHQGQAAGQKRMPREWRGKREIGKAIMARPGQKILEHVARFVRIQRWAGVACLLEYRTEQKWPPNQPAACSHSHRLHPCRREVAVGATEIEEEFDGLH